MTIKKLVAGAKGASGNSTGADIADAVNGLIDAVGVVPAVNFQLHQNQPIGITKPCLNYGRVVANFLPSQWTATIGNPTLTQGFTGYDANGNVTGIKSRTGQAGMLLVEPTVTTATRLQLGTPATNILTPALNGKVGLWCHIESSAANGNVDFSVRLVMSTASGASTDSNAIQVQFLPNTLRETMPTGAFSTAGH